MLTQKKVLSESPPKTHSNGATIGQSTNALLAVLSRGRELRAYWLQEKLRRVLATAVAPRELGGFEISYRAEADRLAQRLVSGQCEDLIADYVRPLVETALPNLLGYPVQGRLSLHRQLDALHHFAPISSRTEDAAAANGRFKEKRSGKPSKPRSSSSSGGFLMFAGIPTVREAMGGLFARLSQKPSVWEELKQGLLELDAVIDECLRMGPPNLFVRRTTAIAMELEKCRIPEGSAVLVDLGAANRDPAQFAGGATFDPDRGGVGSIAFGAGVHRCLGMQLARQQLRISLAALLAAFDHFPSVKQTLVLEGFHGAPAVTKLTLDGSSL